MSNKKVSFKCRLSKVMDKKELKGMVENLGKEGIDWEYKKLGSRFAVYVKKEEVEDIDVFKAPHWFMWKWAGMQFNRVCLSLLLLFVLFR